MHIDNNGQKMEEGQTIVSGNGTAQGNRLLGEYGNEVGYISGSSATINISGSGITLYKQ